MMITSITKAQRSELMESAIITILAAAELLSLRLSTKLPDPTLTTRISI